MEEKRKTIDGQDAAWMQKAALIRDTLIGLMFPVVCPVCGEILTNKNRAEHNEWICRYCFARLQFVKEPYCMKCGAPLKEDGQELCAACESKERFFDRGTALLVHDDFARKMLYDLKYHNKKDNAEFFGKETALRLGAKLSRWAPEAILPVPLHKKREFERGFNQAELLAEKVSKELQEVCGFFLPVDASVLVRQKKTRPQKELDDKDRMRNVQGKFAITAPEILHYRRVLLLDDIYTSGATLNECAKVLKEAGVSEVLFLTMSIVG